MSLKHIATAVAYLQAALHSLDQERLREGGNTKELSVAYTEIETALMWAERDLSFKEDDGARAKYLEQRQPYQAPEFYEVKDLEKLTREERVGMFRYDPLEVVE